MPHAVRVVATAAEFRVLGPVEAERAGRRVRLSRRQQRGLLAVLLLEVGRPVPLERLADLLWGERRPDDPRSVIHTYVSRLRAALAAAGADPRQLQVVRGGGDGYLIDVDPLSIDAHRFADLLSSARSIDDASQRGRMLRDALALWRGPVLADVGEQLQAVVGVRWELMRRSALEARVEADLLAGVTDDLVGELMELAGAEPLSERLAGLLMRALARTGRRAEALEVYRRTRTQMVDELGLEPGHDLHELHQRVLSGEEGTAPDRPVRPEAATTPTGPRQLPAGTAGFVGRGHELALLEKMLGPAGQTGTVVISAIAGAGGLGKSTLAIRAAHRLTEAFPDGQLYVDLRGAAAGLAPREPAEVLGWLLRALGVDGSRIPAGVDEAAALFRTQVATRRLLLVLDNAIDEAQVRPLLPGTAGCGVLVTSRRALAGLDGVSHVHLDVLSPAEAVELLERLVGAERVASHPTATRDLARWCGYLPLALRIAGARLAARPSWPVAVLAERLADERRRLDELELADAGVRASFSASYRELCDSPDGTDRAATEAFDWLGVWVGPDLPLPVVARLLDRAEVDAERLLERLVDARLLETGSPGRFHLHDLLRLYAREQAVRAHPEPDRATALGRVLRLYVDTAWHTLELLRPGNRRLTRSDQHRSTDGLRFDDSAQAVAWLEGERGNLLAAVEQAAGSDELAEAGTQLTQALFGFFQVRGYWYDCERVNRTTLTAATRTGDRAAQAQAYQDLATAEYARSQYQEAMTHLQQSIAICRELGDRAGLATGLSSIGLICDQLGQVEEGLTCLQESLALYQELGDRRGLAASLGNAGTVHGRHGRLDDALTRLTQSLAVYQELGDRGNQALSLNNLGYIYGLQQRYPEALEHARRSLRLHRDLGDRPGEARSLDTLGSIHHAQGRYEEALADYRRSLALCRDLGDRRNEADTLRRISATLQAQGCVEEARARLRDALALYEQLSLATAGDVRTLLAGERPAWR